MATLPQYGGTNGVPELDIGQPGSSRYTDSKVLYTVGVILGPPEMRQTVHELPEQNKVYMGQLGAAGSLVTWDGTIKIKDNTELGALMSELHRFLTGSTLNTVTGVVGAPNTGLTKPTLLKDGRGLALSATGRMLDYRFTERIRKVQTTGWMWISRLRVVFKTLP